MSRACVFLVICFLSFQIYAGEWISIAKNGISPVKTLVGESQAAIAIKFTVPCFYLGQVQINGCEYSTIWMPESSLFDQKGLPELRKITSFVAIPDCERAQAVITSKNYIERPVSALAPSKGRIMRNVNPASVAYEFGEAYKTKGWFPADDQLVTVSEPFRMRDINGVRLCVVPFQYNHEKKLLRVYTDLTVSVIPVGATKSRAISAVTSTDFGRLYQNLFINYNATVSKALNAPEVKKNLLIIAADDFMQAAAPLKEWKTKQGYNVDLVKLSEAGKTAEEIKAYLQKRYDEGKLCFVILVGDAEQIPTLKGKNENANSDPCYVKLAGNDNVPDAFISRISAESAEQVEYIVMKSINYEQFPSQGSDGAWYRQALAIASAEGSPTDYERVDLLNKDLTEKLGFTKIWKCYDSGGSNDGGGNDYPPPYDYPDVNPWQWNHPPYMAKSRDTGETISSDKSVIFDAVNSGVSIINYIGHGGDDCWVTSDFNVSDCGQLKNGMKLPVIWSVACVNGAFVGQTCFAEAWLRSGNRNNPAGCIGIAAASTNMSWVPPCVWQKQIVCEETCKKLHAIASVQNLYGVLKCMEENGTDDSSDGNQLNEQIHYFGDGTVQLRTVNSRAVRVQKEIVGSRVRFSIVGEGSEDCLITVYDDNLNNSRVLRPDSDGRCSLELRRGETRYTVTGPDIIPIIDEEI
ncbi:MAG: C25 family cysteine peptidase [Candidatus Wallbacteria bacterium]|nr:C25 family cysteine peptidase [Candidatus Wallbacteria bacterium]